MAGQGAAMISAMGCGAFLDFVTVLAGSCTHQRSGNEGCTEGCEKQFADCNLMCFVS